MAACKDFVFLPNAPVLSGFESKKTTLLWEVALRKGKTIQKTSISAKMIKNNKIVSGAGVRYYG